MVALYSPENQDNVTFDSLLTHLIPAYLVYSRKKKKKKKKKNPLPFLFSAFFVSPTFQVNKVAKVESEIKCYICNTRVKSTIRLLHNLLLRCHFLMG